MQLINRFMQLIHRKCKKTKRMNEKDNDALARLPKLPLGVHAARPFILWPLELRLIVRANLTRANKIAFQSSISNRPPFVLEFPAKGIG